MMKGFICKITMLMVLLTLPIVTPARHFTKLHSHHSHHVEAEPSKKEGIIGNHEMMRWMRRPPTRMHKRGADTLQIAGSSLPDCSHACGSCTPCRLVMVSFVCSSIEEAETCPMAYKCMCHNKSYPIP